MSALLLNDLIAGKSALGERIWCRKDHADLHLAVTVKPTSLVSFIADAILRHRDDGDAYLLQ